MALDERPVYAFFFAVSYPASGEMGTKCKAKHVPEKEKPGFSSLLWKKSDRRTFSPERVSIRCARPSTEKSPSTRVSAGGRCLRRVRNGSWGNCLRGLGAKTPSFTSMFLFARAAACIAGFTTARASREKAGGSPMPCCGRWRSGRTRRRCLRGRFTRCMWEAARRRPWTGRTFGGFWNMSARSFRLPTTARSRWRGEYTISDRRRWKRALREGQTGFHWECRPFGPGCGR